MKQNSIASSPRLFHHQSPPFVTCTWTTIVQPRDAALLVNDTTRFRAALYDRAGNELSDTTGTFYFTGTAITDEGDGLARGATFGNAWAHAVLNTRHDSVLAETPFQSRGDIFPQPSADGQWVFFTQSDPDVSPAYEVWRIRPDGTDASRVGFPGEEFAGEYHISPSPTARSGARFSPTPWDLAGRWRGRPTASG